LQRAKEKKTLKEDKKKDWTGLKKGFISLYNGRVELCRRSTPVNGIECASPKPSDINNSNNAYLPPSGRERERGIGLYLNPREGEKARALIAPGPKTTSSGWRSNSVILLLTPLRLWGALSATIFFFGLLYRAPFLPPLS
jgi:hypothetical protein